MVPFVGEVIWSAVWAEAKPHTSALITATRLDTAAQSAMVGPSKISWLRKLSERLVQFGSVEQLDHRCLGGIEAAERIELVWTVKTQAKPAN